MRPLNLHKIRNWEILVDHFIRVHNKRMETREYEVIRGGGGGAPYMAAL